MVRFGASFTFVGFICSLSAPAQAHVNVGSGLGVANATQEVTFSVGHGCSGADTQAVSIEIPRGVTSVRPQTSDFGQVDVQTDDAGTVTLISWSKSDASTLQTDTLFYKLAVRLKVPDVPFAALYFPAHQTCRAANGATTTTVDWVGIDEPDGSGVEPAPVLFVVPAHYPGWNQFSLTRAVPDVSVFFKDAQIVWSGSAAYSVNPTTTSLIQGTEGVTVLESLAAGDSIWVKY